MKVEMRTAFKMGRQAEPGREGRQGVYKYPSPFPPRNNSRVAIREGLGRQPALLAFFFGKLTVAPDLIAEGPSVSEILNG